MHAVANCLRGWCERAALLKTHDEAASLRSRPPRSLPARPLAGGPSRLVFELRERGHPAVVIAEDQRAHYEALGFKADGTST